MLRGGPLPPPVGHAPPGHRPPVVPHLHERERVPEAHVLVRAVGPEEQPRDDQPEQRRAEEEAAHGGALLELGHEERAAGEEAEVTREHADPERHARPEVSAAQREVHRQRGEQDHQRLGVGHGLEEREREGDEQQQRPLRRRLVLEERHQPVEDQEPPERGQVRDQDQAQVDGQPRDLVQGADEQRVEREEVGVPLVHVAELASSRKKEQSHRQSPSMDEYLSRYSRWSSPDCTRSGTKVIDSFPKPRMATRVTAHSVKGKATQRQRCTRSLPRSVASRAPMERGSARWIGPCAAPPARRSPTCRRTIRPPQRVSCSASITKPLTNAARCCQTRG